MRDMDACGSVRARMMVVVALACALMLAPAALAQSLERRVQAAIANARMGNAKIGVTIIDVQSGQTLVDITPSGDDALMPASNMKLITTGAAFLVLGKDHELQTRIMVDGDRVIVRGTGDPAFGDPHLLETMRTSIEQFTDRLVESVKKTSPTAIREVVIDDRIFDREYVHPEWPANQLSRAYCAQVSGLNFHANVLNVYVAPGQAGGEPSVRTEPSGSWLTVRRMARTVKEGNTEIWLEREKESFTFKLHGTVRTAVVEPVQVTVNEPSMMFGRYFADRLTKARLGSDQGISVRLANAEDPVKDGPEARAAVVVRTGLPVILERCNVDSDNLYAESLLKLCGNSVTGQPGTWGSGAAVIRMQLKDKLGADAAAKVVISDGSGLSRGNKVSANTLARWLKVLSDAPGGDQFVKSLALAGEEGTLRRRFKGSKLKCEVRAKSGYIREVRTLSGYVTNLETGKRAAFSVLVNEVPSGADARAKELHENIVELLDGYLAGK
ncbi:MAG: D-alanyl-D-alanine carboxypeptidase/D-alanyl-D-alanine-endopeptidase [Phycisphaerales bacterium]|nr:D-alanyl-D-alanine carboxypeptidase/D-alanyl-D-alanine-endopeptidase [Phycisphaerales bacterium]